MRLYETFDEVMSEIKRDLKELAVVYQSTSVQDKVVLGDPDYMTHELLHYTYTLRDPEKALEWAELEFTPEQWDYSQAEFSERLSGPFNPGEAYLYDQEYWEEFLHNGKFSYTYSERFAGTLGYAINGLKRDPNTRQAWVSIWDPQIDAGRTVGDHTARVPCSLGYHFMIRRNKLHMHYVMRSCDFMKHFAKDVYLAIMMQDYVLNEIGNLQMGSFTHTMFSLHAFAKDLKGVF